MTHRRRFLSDSLGLGLAAYLPSLGGEFWTAPARPGFPFTPARTVVLPRRPGRRYSPARRVIERKVEELARMDLWRLPESKVEALLQVAVAVTDHYGIGDRLDAWAERIPIQEAFTSQSCGGVGVLSHWQPREPVAGAGSPMDWWLFLSPEPIGWGGLDEMPIHALIAHVDPSNYWLQLEVMCRAWGDAWSLLRGRGKTDFWPRLARLKPVEAARIMNGR